MNVGRILFQIQHRAPSGPGHSVSLGQLEGSSSQIQDRTLPLSYGCHSAVWELWGWLQAGTVQMDLWCAGRAQGAHGMGIVGKEAKIHQQNSMENCDSARIGLGYKDQNKWKATSASCELSFLKERLSLPSALVSLGRCWGCGLLLLGPWVLKEVVMPGQGLLSEQQGETDSEQCKRKEKAFLLPLFGDIFSVSSLWAISHSYFYLFLLKLVFNWRKI